MAGCAPSGPVAAAFGGQAEMSGLPEPAMPVGWGYSYLDWMGAYGYALALLGALYHRERTGEGQWIDASQCESGHLPDRRDDPRLVGERARMAPLRQPLALQAGGAARRLSLRGQGPLDRDRLLHRCRVAGAGAASPGSGDWLDDRRFATLESRLLHQDALDAAVEAWTATQDRYDCMMKLQSAGVPAGVCQNAEDRCDNDPQLRHLNWLTEVTGTKIGTWPVYELPMKLSARPRPISAARSTAARRATARTIMWVLTELLGRTPSEVERLAEEGVI